MVERDGNNLGLESQHSRMISAAITKYWEFSTLTPVHDAASRAMLIVIPKDRLKIRMVCTA